MNYVHAVAVHFPIALVMAAVLFEVIGVIRKQDTLRQVALWNLRLGFIVVLVALYSGLQVSEVVPTQGKAFEIMQTHKLLGIVFTSILGVATLLSVFIHKAAVARWRPLLTILIIMAAGVVGYGSHLGGTMVYEHGLGIEIQQSNDSNRPIVTGGEAAYKQLMRDGMCIVIPEERVDPNLFVEYEGERIFFCCKKCLRKFKENPDVYLQ